MRAIHFIERLGNMHCVDKDTATWESGWWHVSAETAQQLVGGCIFLHKAQRDPSFSGGKITGFRMESGDGFKGLRAVFRFHAEPECIGVDAGREGWGMEKKIVRG